MRAGAEASPCIGPVVEALLATARERATAQAAASPGSVNAGQAKGSFSEEEADALQDSVRKLREVWR